jgi:hypothetical protein
MDNNIQVRRDVVLSFLHLFERDCDVSWTLLRTNRKVPREISKRVDVMLNSKAAEEEKGLLVHSLITMRVLELV